MNTAAQPAERAGSSRCRSDSTTGRGGGRRPIICQQIQWHTGQHQTRKCHMQHTVIQQLCPLRSTRCSMHPASRCGHTAPAAPASKQIYPVCPASCCLLLLVSVWIPWSDAVHSDSSRDTQPSSDSRWAAGPSTSEASAVLLLGTTCRHCRVHTQPRTATQANKWHTHAVVTGGHASTYQLC